MILITGATGNVGAATVAELLASGHSVRAFARDAGRARARLGDGVAVAAGDFDDAASIARALDGVDAVLLSSADQPDKPRHEIAVIDAAKAAGVSRIVKVSTRGAAADSPLPPFDWHGRIEEHLLRSEIPSVILHSNFYMTNLLASAPMIAATGSLIAPAAGAKVAMIDPRDTGAVAAVALTAGAYDGTTLEPTGPEAITYEQIAEHLSAATGRTIPFVAVPDEASHAALLEAGMPGWLVAHLDHLFPLLRQGEMAEPTDVVRLVTGREPRSFAAWANDHAAAFAGG